MYTYSPTSIEQNHNNQNAAHNFMTCREAIASYLLIPYHLNQKPHRYQSRSGFSGRTVFDLGSVRAQAWILKIYQASIEPDAGAKTRFLVSDRAFVIAGIKQSKHLAL